MPDHGEGMTGGREELRERETERNLEGILKNTCTKKNMKMKMGITRGE